MSDMAALKPSTMLADDYRIERVIGAGGFGITYLAEEVSLARLVTIKEYFPVDFAARDSADDVVPRSQGSKEDYEWGLDRFLAEAQTLARFNHPNIVRVYRFFQARSTAYIVLHYEEGQSLKGWLRSLGRAPRQHELDKLLEPLLSALETVHAADYLHRDIAPDNIMIRRDGQPVLIDFGSARGDIAKHSKTISALVKPGYSPYEQYATTSRQQGPWTDIYSLGATLYEAVTNKRPPDSPSRMVHDEMIPPADAALSSYRPAFLAAIARSLRLEVTERPRSVTEWRTELMAEPARAAPSEQAPPPDAAEKADKAAASKAQKPSPHAPGKPTPKPAAARTPEMADAAHGRADAALQPSAKAGAPAPGASPASGTRKGLADAFLAGWRKAAPAESDSIRAANPSPPLARPASPPHTPPPIPREAKPAAKSTPPASPKQTAAKPADADPAADSAAAPPRIFARATKAKAIVAAPAEAAGARQATPRALRRRSAARWPGLLVKLLIGIMVAAAAVAIQDRLPTVRREGAGLLTSHSGSDVALPRFPAHTQAVTGIAYTSDSAALVSASIDGTLKVWDAAHGKLLATFHLDGGPSTALAVADGRAATAHADGTVTTYDLATGDKIATVKHGDAPIHAIVFAGGPTRLAAAGEDATLSVWDLSQPAAPTQRHTGHQGAIHRLAFASRGPFVASGGADTTVKLWHLEKNELVRTYTGHDAPVTALALNKAGTVLASADQDGQLRLWSTYAKRLKRRLSGHEGGVAALAFTPDGEYLVSGGADATIRIWGAQTGKLKRTFKAASAPVTALTLSPDGRRIAAAFADGAIRIFDASPDKQGT